jgi:hypothetical protein
MIGFLRRLFSVEHDASLRDKFSRIYVNNVFGGTKSRSGEGSDMVQTATIRRELPKLVHELGIKRFLDAPCGDWFWMKETELDVADYIGVDIVGKIVEINGIQYGGPSRKFLCLNLAEDPLPQSDLIFCRDCLVHLNFHDIRRVISNFRRSRSTYLLTTTFTGRRKNVDLVGKDVWRTLNLQAAPFNFPSPLRLINEGCTEANERYADKCLGLWRLEDLPQ